MHRKRSLGFTIIFGFFINALFLQATALANTAVEAPNFSHGTGFYADPFNLALQHPQPNVTIYYTLDGSIPSPDNINKKTYRYKNNYTQPPRAPIDAYIERPYQSYLYDESQPISITARQKLPNRLTEISTTHDKYPSYFPGEAKATWKNQAINYTNKAIYQLNRIIREINRGIRRIGWFPNTVYIRSIEELQLIKEPTPVYKGTLVRAIAVDQHNNTSNLISQLYFIDGFNPFSLPIVNISVPEAALFDYQDGVFVAGYDYDTWLLNIIKGKEGLLHNKPQANWQRQGTNIPAHFHLFEQKKPAPSVEQMVDIRVHGGGSRALANKSIRVYPRKRYSKKGINHPLLSDSPHGLTSLILRNAGQHNSHTYVADAAVQQAMRHLNIGTQYYQPVVVFINGEYYGLLNARYRHDKNYFASQFNLPSTKIDVLQNNQTIRYGDATSWQKTIDFINDADKNDPSFIKKLNKLIDIDSFIDYQTTEIFIANVDWPHNNIRYWRYRGSKDKPITQHGYTDGRWRWLLFDLDHMGGGIAKNNASHNTLEHATTPTKGWSTFMLRTLLENPEFKQQFITRFSDLLNSTFQPNHINAEIDTAVNAVSIEMPRHIQRWKSPESVDSWQKSVANLKAFFTQRPAHQWQQLQQFFGLKDPYRLSVDMRQDTGEIDINSLTVQSTWQGQYFKSLPLQLHAKPAAGYRFSHWEADGLSAEQQKNPKLILNPDGDLAIRAVMLEAAPRSQ